MCFGKLLVLKRVENTKYGRTRWLCICECGNETIVNSKYLLHEDTRSCGCLISETSSKKADNLIGQKFNKLLVIERSGSDNRGQAVWTCKCDCGNYTKVITSKLKNNNTKSCGCWKVENGIIQGKKARYRNVGAKSPRWKGGITSLYEQIRNLHEYKQWYLLIFERDKFICQNCGVLGGTIHAHHVVYFNTIIKIFSIKSLEEAKECGFLWDINNGITLCKECHYEFHKIYGKKQALGGLNVL